MLSFFEECAIVFPSPSSISKKQRCLEYYFPLRQILAVAHITSVNCFQTMCNCHSTELTSLTSNEELGWQVLNPNCPEQLAPQKDWQILWEFHSQLTVNLIVVWVSKCWTLRDVQGFLQTAGAVNDPPHLWITSTSTRPLLQRVNENGKPCLSLLRSMNLLISWAKTVDVYHWDLSATRWPLSKDQSSHFSWLRIGPWAVPPFSAAWDPAHASPVSSEWLCPIWPSTWSNLVCPVLGQIQICHWVSYTSFILEFQEGRKLWQ